VVLPCRIRKGELLLIPIIALNRDVEIWGPDAMEFVCVLVLFFLLPSFS
jgi:cytochrome P450